MDTSGDQFTVKAGEEIVDAIKKYGTTSSIEKVGKAVYMTEDGAKVSSATTDPATFGGIIFAVSGEAETNLTSKVPYFDGNYTIPKGKYFTMARNCLIHVMGDATIKEGDMITLGADGSFTKTTDATKKVGTAYSNPSSNNIIYAYIGAQ
jgi:hypothetical protein